MSYAKAMKHASNPRKFKMTATRRRGNALIFGDGTRDGWTPASVGCHWTRGEYSISTYWCGAESGYALYRHGSGEVGRYGSFEEAAKAAARDDGGAA